MKTLIKCDSCGIDFLKENRYINYATAKGHKLYCSKDCVNEGKTTALVTDCATCGVSITKTRAEVSRSKTGNLYCSKSCAVTKNNTLFKTGENHPNYQGGPGDYRARAFAVYEKKCIVCGYTTEEVLQVHHIDEDRSNNDLSNLTIVCPTHHIEFHRGIIKYSDYENSNN